MKRTSIAMAALFAVLLLPGLSGPAHAEEATGVNVDLSFFHDPLAAYGDWIQVDPYGWVWTPWGVSQDWRPYMVGRWAYTDCDWAWVSDEPWGWATYHYGRWSFDVDHGWLWVPDSTWGPAWVAWRGGGGYVGWAALEPGMDPLGDDFGNLDPFSYCFVDERFFLDPVLAGRVQPVARNVTCLDGSKDITSYTISGGLYLNHGVDLHEVEHASGHSATRLRLRTVSGAGPFGWKETVKSNELRIYRPPAQPAGAQAAVFNPAPSVRKETQTGIARRQLEEQKRLQAGQAEERRQLRSIHKQEWESRPPKITSDQLRQRQFMEDEAQAAHEQTSQEMLQARHANEQQGAGAPPPAAAHPRAATPAIHARGRDH